MNIDSIVEVCLEKVREREQLLEKCKTLEEKSKWLEETLHKYRCDIEPYIYQHLILEYGQKLDKIWKDHQFPKKSKYAWVIIERRSHINWWFLLRNIVWAAPHFSLYIFCSDQNYEFVKNMLGDKVNNVHIIQWYKGFASRDEGRDQYAVTMKQAELYRKIDAEYMIRVEMDTYLRHKIPELIFKTDFYGAPWKWNLNMPGGGGLHIRKISTMIDLCERANHSGTEGEDSWLGGKIIEYGYTYPPLEFRELVFSENYPVDNPIGVHQFWTFLDNFEIKNREKFRQHLKRYLTINID